MLRQSRLMVSRTILTLQVDISSGICGPTAEVHTTRMPAFVLKGDLIVPIKSYKIEVQFLKFI
jgi:hypothetical protein